MNFQDYTNDAIAIIVTTAGTGYAGYVTYLTGEIPEFFAMGFGLVIAFFFTRALKTEDKK